MEEDGTHGTFVERMKLKEEKEDFYIKLKNILAQKKRVRNFGYNSRGDILL